MSSMGFSRWRGGSKEAINTRHTWVNPRVESLGKTFEAAKRAVLVI
jgi:hypothetical protein